MHAKPNATVHTFSTIDASELVWLLQLAEDDFTRDEIRRLVGEEIARDRYQQSRPIRLGGFALWLNPCNPTTSLELYLEIFKFKLSSGLKALVHPSAEIVIDIGANEGFYTLLLSSLLPEATVFAIEPNPIAFSILQRNLESNRIANAKLAQCAIMDKTCRMNMQIVPAATALGGMRIRRWPWVQDEIRSIKVDSTTLPDFLNGYGIRHVDLLKIDVEGAELRILKTARPLFPLFDALDIEYHSDNLGAGVKRLLRPSHDLVKEDPENGELHFVRKKVSNERAR